ncbi:NAD(P)/FAD-dependent oxidoreductase [Saccharomonospora piscinae]|uniref:NAD(P)/FAD-dependent oxidoreductase n=1 Tax=Saccharomonospora piscinae TaxID=687388 RepID=UPI001106261D|nr:FAD-dependent oxidoreductase [Saccharomonospora piscinae]TLW90444.1 NAD(P)/FAD-dependent oxidoreductase [Saccharomonospora piscinae]
MTTGTVTIIGASLAGAKAAEELRTEGFSGRVILIGAEPDLPYERPPLSKEYLQGDAERASLAVHDEDWYADNDVELLLGTAAVEIHRDTHEVELADGRRVPYSALVLTTGASPRRLSLPGAELAGVHYLREVGDSERLRDALRAGGRVAVIGAGWIGLEVAAAARRYGCEVTVLEAQDVPLASALGSELGAYFGDLHRRHGVEVRTGHRPTALVGSDGRVIGVSTDAGDDIAADTVVVGIGVRPNTSLARGCGLAVSDGVVVDEYLRTSDPRIHAAGDVASAYRPWYGGHVRVEHWAAALGMGPSAARAVLERGEPYDDLPFFFTDQYDVGMEFAGFVDPRRAHRVVLRGDVDADSFHAFWLADGRVVAGLHVNRWDDGIEPVQRMIRGHAEVDAALLADTTAPLGEVAASV